MAKKNDTTFFENKLLDFVTAKDPMLDAPMGNGQVHGN